MQISAQMQLLYILQQLVIIAFVICLQKINFFVLKKCLLANHMFTSGLHLCLLFSLNICWSELIITFCTLREKSPYSKVSGPCFPAFELNIERYGGASFRNPLFNSNLKSTQQSFPTHMKIIPKFLDLTVISIRYHTRKVVLHVSQTCFYRAH